MENGENGESYFPNDVPMIVEGFREEIKDDLKMQTLFI